MLQKKKEAIAKKERKEIAALVERGKEETARVKTEGIIAEDVSGDVGRHRNKCSPAPLLPLPAPHKTQIHIELLEILELYCETLLARFTLLDLPG